MAAAAAAIAVGIFVFVERDTTSGGELICYVNGERITDPHLAEEYAASAIEHINATLRKPSEYLSAKSTQSPTMKRVEEMLNTLSSQQ
jgi:hypothetical protein